MVKNLIICLFYFFRLVDIKVIASIEYQVIIDKYRVGKKSCANQSMTRKSMQSIHSEPVCSEAYCCCSMSIEWIIVLSFQRHVHCECSLSLCLNGSCGVCHFSSACVTMTLPPSPPPPPLSRCPRLSALGLKGRLKVK